MKVMVFYNLGAFSRNGPEMVELSGIPRLKEIPKGIVQIQTVEAMATERMSAQAGVSVIQVAVPDISRSCDPGLSSLPILIILSGNRS